MNQDSEGESERPRYETPQMRLINRNTNEKSQKHKRGISENPNVNHPCHEGGGMQCKEAN